MEILELIRVPYYKNGSGIHIKKENQGKFTKSAKEHDMEVQEFASHVLNNKDKYSPTLVKRANFAHNSKKFKHAKGGLVKKAYFGTEITNSQDDNQPRTAGVQGMELLRKEPLYQNADRRERANLRKQMRQTGEVSWDYDTWRNASVPKEWRDREDRFTEYSNVQGISDSYSLEENGITKQIYDQGYRVNSKDDQDINWTINREINDGNSTKHNQMIVSTSPYGGYNYQLIEDGNEIDYQENVQEDQLPSWAKETMSRQYTENSNNPTNMNQLMSNYNNMLKPRSK